MAAGSGRMRMQIVTPGAAQPSADLARPGSRRRSGRGRGTPRVFVPGLVRQAGSSTEVAGVGCPDSQGDGVSLAAATTGPGWTAAGGGWTGNGCNGSSVWTMDPNGNQPSPSTLTWFFHPGPRASACRVGVFVPTQNALGVASYEVTDGTVGLGTVSVDQSASAGQWITLGRYPVSGGMLDIQLLPGTATLTAAMTGNGGKGNPGNGGAGKAKGNGKGGKGDGAPGPGQAAPTPSPAPGHNAAVAASAASATCS
jgi:hypothetical protein